MIPLQISFLDFPESDAVWMAVQKRVEKLEHFYDRIVRCEVAVSCPHRHRHTDRLFHVRIHIFLPGSDVVVNRDPSLNESHRDMYVAIRDAFDKAERVLQDKIHLMRNKHGPRAAEVPNQE
jgi:ribosomal subunit interface protein